MKSVKSRTKVLWCLSGVFLMTAGCNQSSPPNTQTTAYSNSTNQVAPAAAEVTEPNQGVRAYVRAVHTVRGAGPVTLAIDGEKVITDLAFGNASDFVGVQDEKVKIHASGAHQITVMDAEGTRLGEPLPLDLERGEDFTVVVGGAPGRITLTPFEHTSRGPALEQAKVAVLHADRALPEVRLSVDGKNWRGDIGFGEVTGYQKLAAGQHTLKAMYDKSLVGVVDVDRRPGVSPPAPVAVKGSSVVTLTQPLNLQAGKVYSVIVYADAGGMPKLRFLEDKFVPPLIRAHDAAVAQ